LIGRAPQASPIRYRPDIDGLRAIAVLLVVAYHMNLALPRSVTLWIEDHISWTVGNKLSSGISGGFVGVDVFFVISGFLIGGILLREQANGTFSIVKFYERRVRRIVPALVVVLLFTCVAAWAALVPAEMKDFAWSSIAATFSWANIYFWKTSGYFDIQASTKPLLHTWSLAVEEQFYLFLPVFLLAAHRFFRRRLKAAVVVLALASFISSAIAVYRDPTAAFYLAHTRAWELLTGTLLALQIVPVPSSRHGRNLASLVGLALVLGSALWFSSLTKFPGANALVPCLGAALIITAGVTGSSAVGWFLSARPVAFIGLISYSLYLWHWPLMLINELGYFHWFHLSKIWLLMVMLLIATLSWRFVEHPFRDGALRLPRQRLFVAAASAAVLLTSLSLWALVSNGIPSRFTQDDLMLAHYLDHGSLEAQWGQGCFASKDLASIQQSCLEQSSDKPNYLLFGDSAAAHLWYGLSTVYPEIHFSEATASRCKPLLTSRGSSDPFCRHLVESVFDHFLPTHRVDAVILSAPWSSGNLRPLGETVAQLHAAKLRVYVIGPIIDYDQPLPGLLIKANRSGDPTIPGKHSHYTYEEYKYLDNALAKVALGNGADRYISLRKMLCPAVSCMEYVAPRIPLQFDGMHLTNPGSVVVSEKMQNTHQMP
jgi:peptidoglycan/LPS O-acetylase OafA/YrhL